MAVAAPPPGMYAWYRSDDVTLEDTDKVASWNDKAGGGRHIAAAGSLRPVYGSAQLNGLDVLTFDGSMRLARASTPDLPQTLTWVVFGRLTDTSDTGTDRVLMASANDAGTDAIKLMRAFAGAKTGHGTIYAGTTLDNGDPAPDTSWHWYIALVDASDGALLIDDNLTVSGSGGSYTMNGLAVGNNVAGLTAGGWIGDIAEAIVYDRELTFDEMAVIRRYAWYRYGLGSAPEAAKAHKITGYAVLELAPPNTAIFSSAGGASSALEGEAVTAPEEGDLASAGVGAASFVGVTSAGANVSAAGAGSAAMVGSTLAQAEAAAAGVGALAAVGLARASTAISSSGQGSLAGVGSAVAQTEAAAAGAGALAGAGSALAHSTASAAGTGTMAAVGLALAATEASAAGAAALTGVGSAVAGSALGAAGAGTMAAVGAALALTDAVAAGSGALAAVGSALASTDLSAAAAAAAAPVGSAVVMAEISAAGAGELLGRIEDARDGVTLEIFGTGTFDVVGSAIAGTLATMAGLGSFAAVGSAIALTEAAAAAAGALNGVGSAVAGSQTAIDGQGALQASGTALAGSTLAAAGAGALTAYLTAIAGTEASMAGAASMASAGATLRDSVVTVIAEASADLETNAPTEQFNSEVAVTLLASGITVPLAAVSALSLEERPPIEVTVDDAPLVVTIETAQMAISLTPQVTAITVSAEPIRVVLQ